MVDSDDLARKVVHPRTKGLARLQTSLGRFLKADGSLDRDKMASTVFQDEAARKRLKPSFIPCVALSGKTN